MSSVIWLTGRYMSNFPPAVCVNFFNAVNQRQAAFIKEEYDNLASGNSSSRPGLSSLPGSIVQLLLGEPAMMNNPDMAAIIDSTVEASTTPMEPLAVMHGLTPLIVHLLSSPSHPRREWAKSQLPAISRQPLSFDDWCSLGIGVQMQAIYTGATELKGVEKWDLVSVMVSRGAFSSDVITKGILEGRNTLTRGAQSGKSLMAVLAPLLGAPGPGESHTDCR
jgi:senataxin